MAVIRAVESRRIERKFERGQIIITSFGVNFFGRESDAGGLLRSAGALVLLQDGLYYRARFANREIMIPKSAITGIGYTNVFKKKSLHQNAVVIFLNDETGRPDRAVFRMPRPSQWMDAIKANLLNKS